MKCEKCNLEKIAIIGSPGAGKTTLARTLSRILKIKVYHLDRLFWKTGWQSIDGPTRIDILQNLAQEKQWIIEGTYLHSSEPRLNAADTIIFLDTNPLICLWRVIKRYREEHGLFRRDIPEQCVDKLNLHRMLKLLVFSMKDRTKLKQKLRTYKSKQIIWLRSKREVEVFFAEQVLDAAKGNNSFDIPPVAKKNITSVSKKELTSVHSR